MKNSARKQAETANASENLRLLTRAVLQVTLQKHFYIKMEYHGISGKSTFAKYPN
jgi:hypothetical protein